MTPTKNMKRALRRHDRHAKQWRRLRVDRLEHGGIAAWGSCGCFNDPKEIGQMADTPCRCSRSCCGNPRKWWRALTRQELRFVATADEHIGGAE